MQTSKNSPTVEWDTWPDWSTGAVSRTTNRSRQNVAVTLVNLTQAVTAGSLIFYRKREERGGRSLTLSSHWSISLNGLRNGRVRHSFIRVSSLLQEDVIAQAQVWRGKKERRGQGQRVMERAPLERQPWLAHFVSVPALLCLGCQSTTCAKAKSGPWK